LWQLSTHSQYLQINSAATFGIILLRSSNIGGGGKIVALPCMPTSHCFIGRARLVLEREKPEASHHQEEQQQHGSL
jgi:hypothetical protein